MTSNASFTSCDQSSGSICSASEVEPTTSANTAVTGLRSPDSLAAHILSTSGAGAAAASAAWRVSSDSVEPASGWPHLAQKRASAVTGDSQRGQVRAGESTDIGPNLTPRLLAAESAARAR